MVRISEYCHLVTLQEEVVLVFASREQPQENRQENQPGQTRDYPSTSESHVKPCTLDLRVASLESLCYAVFLSCKVVSTSAIRAYS